MNNRKFLMNNSPTYRKGIIPFVMIGGLLFVHPLMNILKNIFTHMM